MIASTPVAVKWLVKVKGCRPAGQRQRQQAEQVGEQDEHEDARRCRERTSCRRANIGSSSKLVDEAGEAFDRHLPAARNELALHAARHEHHSNRGDNHPQRRIGEGDVVAARFAR
jgi:hypothetical protein